MNNNVLELIGNTPLVKLQGFDTGLCELFIKLESNNPGGSIKDRIALSIIDSAEKAGHIKPGDTIVEATAGNTGIGLTLVAMQKGYKSLLVVFDKVTREKINFLRAMGATVVITRTDVSPDHPDHYHQRAKSIAASNPGHWWANQFGNPANPLAHELTTGPEIWEQLEHKVDAVVCGVGSGGTLTGLGKFFSEVAPNCEMVLADPVGSILAHYVNTGEISKESGSWLVEGIGDDYLPDIANFSYVKKTYSINDKESILAVRELLQTNGISAGSSSGTLLAAALKYCKEQKAPKRVVTFALDKGSRYLSKQFNDYWLMDQGIISRKSFGDLRDLISRHYSDGAIVPIKPEEPLFAAYQRMKSYDISQLPVMEENKIIGIIDEQDMLLKIIENKDNLKKTARECMSKLIAPTKPSDSIDSLPPLFARGLIAVIADDDNFYGLVTRMDYIDYLRRKI